MTLIDDTCDSCGMRFDPMGDPPLTRHPEISEYAVYCAGCEAEESPTVEDIAYKRFLSLMKVARLVSELEDLIVNEGVEVEVSAVDIRNRLQRALQ